MTTLERITTEYIDFEDRIRLSGEVGNAAPVVVWLTRRLLQRLLPVLLQRLELPGADAPLAEVLHGFAQQAARAELAPQAPVRAGAGSTVWLAMSVDIVQLEQTVSLTFRGADGQKAILTLAAKPLRQWLSILHDAYIKAEWPLGVWPEWLRECVLPAKEQVVVLH
jgi:hypothetical protein